MADCDRPERRKVNSYHDSFPSLTAELSLTMKGKLAAVCCWKDLLGRVTGLTFMPVTGNLVRLLLWLLLLLLVSFPSSVSDSSADFTPDVELKDSEGILDSSKA